MAGHNKWTQIKHQKGIADKKRGAVFSKILKAVSIAAREEPNPNFNPRLRTMIERAKEANVPQENINRAIQKTKETEVLEELVIEAYGPGGVALIINAITDSHNRTISEIKHILSGNEAKIANPGSVLWAFEEERPKFPQQASDEARIKIKKLVDELESREDVQKIITNLKSQ